MIDCSTWGALEHLLGDRLPDAWLAARAQFEASGAAEPTVQVIEPALLDEAITALGCDDDLARALHATALRLAEDAAAGQWAALAQFCRWSLLQASGPAAELAHWPALHDLPQDVPLFYALVFLSTCATVRERQARRGIPAEITCATLGDLLRWVEAYRATHGGAPGLQNVGWLANHWRGDLLALGRLQFQWGHHYYPCHLLRHRQTGAVLGLAEAGLMLDSDGWPAAEQNTLPSGVWRRTTWRQQDHHLTAHPLRPRGAVMWQPLDLDLRVWDVWLQPGDPVLHVHIPAGEPLDHAAAVDSYERALREMPAYYPERVAAGQDAAAGRGFAAYCCESWLIDPQLGDWLAPESNVVRFMRDWRPIPLPGADGGQLFERVFGTRQLDPATAPRDSRLRRAVLDHIAAGGAWRKMGGVIDVAARPWQAAQG